jgi:hypothetical protein
MGCGKVFVGEKDLRKRFEKKKNRKMKVNVNSIIN